jgi:hypothetical protein
LLNLQGAGIDDPSCGNWPAGDTPTIEVDFLLTSGDFEMMKVLANGKKALTKPHKFWGNFGDTL